MKVDLRLTYASKTILFENIDESVVDEISVLTTSSTGRSVSFPELLFPVDVAELVEAGYPLSDARGDVLVDGVVLMSGVASEPTYGAVGQPVSLTISCEPFNDTAIIPALDEIVVVASGTEGDDGAVFPTVFGRPGVFFSELGVQKQVGGTTAPMLHSLAGTAHKIIACGHPVDLPKTVKVINSDGGTADIALTVDATSGAMIVDLTGQSAPFRTADPYYISWTSAALPFGAGDVLAYLLEKSTLAVDWKRWGNARSRLNEYTLAGYIDTNISPWNYIESELNDYLSIAWSSSADGIFPIFLDYYGPPTWEIRKGIRTSPISYERDKSDIINDLRVDYAWNEKAGAYARSLTIDEPQSIDRFGKSSDVISLGFVSHRPTAFRIARDLLDRKAWLHRSVTYMVDEVKGSPGDIVSITDPEVSLNEARAIIRSINRTPDSVLAEIEVLLIDQRRT
jgi:hypothetical protein